MAEASVQAKDVKKRTGKGPKLSRGASQNEDAKGNGKRGRPRVDAQDQSAIERRRTQIRLAQRAYRERKETTISDLEKQVDQLQNSLDLARSLVLSFRDTATASNLAVRDPAISLELEELAHQVLNLAGRGDTEVAKPLGRQPKSPVGRTSPTPARTMEPVFSSGAQQNEWLPQTFVPERDITAPMGYQLIYDNPEQIIEEELAAVPLPIPSVAQAIQRFQPSPESELEIMDRWVPSIPLNPKPAFSYNFQESSFARRLTRECYERSYHLLTDPNTSPERVHQMLRYSLCFGSVKSIADRIKKKLMSSRNDPLEQWNLPVMNVAGAGLNFPRAGRDGGQPFEQTGMTRNIGPFEFPKADVEAPSEYFPYEIAQWVGLEGVWYDAYDVEAFLRSRGLQLDGTSPIASMEVEEPLMPGLERSTSSPGSSSSMTFSNPQSPASDERPIDFLAPNVEEVLASFSNGDFNLDTEMKMDDIQPLDSRKTGITGLSPAPFVQAKPPQQQIATVKRTILIDVDRLITALNNDTICLGRSPGYKQEHVEQAFNRVIEDAY